MNAFFRSIRILFVLVLTVAAFTGCESTGGGGGASVYYGVGFYDPWYYGDYDHDHDIVVTPPDRPNRPDRPVHPEQPIARPPSASSRPSTASPSARSMPSIPSTPRVSSRGGGGRR